MCEVPKREINELFGVKFGLLHYYMPYVTVLKDNNSS